MRSVVEPTTTVVAVLTMQLHSSDEDHTIHSKKECCAVLLLYVLYVLS